MNAMVASLFQDDLYLIQTEKCYNKMFDASFLLLILLPRIITHTGYTEWISSSRVSDFQVVGDKSNSFYK